MALENKALSVIRDVGREIKSLPLLRFRNRYLAGLQWCIINEAKLAVKILNFHSDEIKRMFVEKELFSIHNSPLLLRKLRGFFINNNFVLSKKFFSSSLTNLIDLYLKKYIDYDKDLIKKEVAILYTDMAGFSVKVARNEKFAVLTTLLYFQTFMKIIEKYNGVGEISGGDSILCILPTSRMALMAAIEIYHTFNEMNRKVIDDLSKIRIRMGLSYGMIFTNNEGKPFISHHINMAQRVSDKGGKGPFIRTRHQNKYIAGRKWASCRKNQPDDNGIWTTDIFYKKINYRSLFLQNLIYWSVLIKGTGINKFWKVKTGVKTLKKLG